MHAVGRLILAPRLLPLLLAAWLAAPSGPKGGLLFFDSLVHEEDLTRGAWPAVLSAVLTAITRASLPALLLELADAADGTAAQDPLGLRSRVPSSECVGASVAGAKLVFEGRVNAVQGQPPLAYTLRTGVSCRRSALGLDGVTRLPSECSSLCWEEPELRLSLGETGLAGMLPKLWLHLQRAQRKRPPSLSSFSWERRSAPPLHASWVWPVGSGSPPPHSRGAALAAKRPKGGRDRLGQRWRVLSAFDCRPVADAGGLQLPPSVHLTRASVSEAAAGLRASGTIRLGASPEASGGGLVTVIQ